MSIRSISSALAFGAGGAALALATTECDKGTVPASPPSPPSPEAGIDASTIDAEGDASPTDATAPIGTTDETQYLDFLVQVAGLYDPKTGSGAGDAAAMRAVIDTDVAGLSTTIGATGDGRTRQLGFMFIALPWELEPLYPGKTATAIAQAFDVALARHVAFHLTIETHYLWGNRPDLWNFFDASAPGYSPSNTANVEWSDWDAASAYRWRFLDWGAPQALDAPHMCYLSARIQSEVARLGALIGAAVKQGIDTLAAAGHPELFSGVTVGSEPSLDDYSVVYQFDPPMAALMVEAGAPRVRLGYCAFTAMGYSASNPPPDLFDAAAQANTTFIGAWARAVASAGVPASKLYTHIAGSSHGAGLEFTNAPVSVAFVGSARPGWTTYAVGPLKADFSPLVAALAQHGNPHWGGTEAAPFDGTGTIDSYEYLRRHYENGATVVVMNVGATGSLGSVLQRAVYGPDAIGAYRRFLTGQ